jgi:threonine/homoserine/homoserine lactone efflux protein
MGAGGVVFAAAAIAGMTAVLARAPWLFVALKAAAGAYLLLAWRLWRHADDRAVRVGHGPAPAGAFAAGPAVLAAQLGTRRLRWCTRACSRRCCPRASRRDTPRY